MSKQRAIQIPRSRKGIFKLSKAKKMSKKLWKPFEDKEGSLMRISAAGHVPGEAFSEDHTNWGNQLIRLIFPPEGQNPIAMIHPEQHKETISFILGEIGKIESVFNADFSEFFMTLLSQTEFTHDVVDIIEKVGSFLTMLHVYEDVSTTSTPECFYKDYARVLVSRSQDLYMQMTRRGNVDLETEKTLQLATVVLHRTVDSSSALHSFARDVSGIRPGSEPDEAYRHLAYTSEGMFRELTQRGETGPVLKMILSEFGDRVEERISAEPTVDRDVFYTPASAALLGTIEENKHVVCLSEVQRLRDLGLKGQLELLIRRTIGTLELAHL